MAEQNDLTFVDSVNICLSAIGEQPTTGDGSGKVTVAATTNRIVQITADLLKEVTIDVENRGWDFQATTGTVEGIDITSNKYDWNALHTVSFKRYVTIRAARVLQARYVTDETLHTFSAAEEAFSYANLQQVDATARLAAQFKLPDSITNLGIEKTDFLAGTVEEKLGYLRMATEVNNTQLVNAQKLRVDEETDLLQQQFLTEVQETAKKTAEKNLLVSEKSKTDAEKSLINDQEALVTQQKLTEIQETAKRTAEKDLVIAQDAKTDAETELIKDQEALVTQQKLTEVQETAKRTSEKALIDAQELKTDAETELVKDQEALVTQQALTEAKETAKRESEKNLLVSQKLKTDAETDLVIDQEALVTQQTLTEVQETAKRTSEKALVDAQELKVDAESSLIAEQELKLVKDKELVVKQTELTTDQKLLIQQQKLTEIQETAKRQAEKDLVIAQDAKTDAETELIKDQESLVAQQALTEAEETAKRTAEKNLIVKQDTKTTAETALIQDQEVLVAQQALTEVQETAKRSSEKDLVDSQKAKTDAEKNLVNSQKSKTDQEKELIIDQEALITQQRLTEIEETAKRTAEKDLLVAQELQVDAQTAKTSAERNTETRVQQKLEEETDLLQAQEERLTAETVYMVTAEKDYLDVLKSSSVFTSNIFYNQRTTPTYNSKRDAFRMMGIKEADFAAAPAYKKLSMLEEADAFIQVQMDNTTSTSLPTARTGGYGYWAVEMYEKLGYGKATNSNESTIVRWLYDSYLNNLYTLGERKLSWTRRTIKITADSNGRLKAPLSSGFVIGGGRTYNSYTYYRIDGKQLGYEPHTENGEDYNILVDLSLEENQSTSFNGEYTVEVGQTMDSHQSNGIAPLFENWVQAYTLLQFVETYPVNATEVDKFRKEEARFRSLMEQEEAELGQYNILDSTDVAQRVGHNRNYNLL